MANPQNIDFQQEKQGASVASVALPSVTPNILAAFLDLAPDALIITNSAGTITQVNVQMEALFGYGRDELPGHQLEILLPERFRVAHEVQRPRYMQAASPRPMGIGLDLVGLHKDGNEFPVDVSLRPLLIGNDLHVMGAVRNMTAQRLAERERPHIAERLRQQDKLINLAHDAILVRDPESRILSWNEGAEHLYGWTAQEAMGQVTHTLLQTRFPISREEVDRVLEQHGQWEGELIHTCQDGRQVIVESRHVLVRDALGTPTAILEVNRDITERRRLEHLAQEAQAEKDARLTILQLILDHLSTGVALMQGSNMRLLMTNQAATALWGAEWQRGKPREEYLQEQGIRFFTVDGRPVPLADSPIRRAMISGEPVLRSQLVIRQPDGTRLPVLLDVIPLDHLHLLPRLPQEITAVLDPAERVVLVVYHDVTALKEAEGIKDQFISLATHELRTPVTVVAGYIDLLLRRTARTKEHQLDTWQVTRLEEMKQAIQQLANLTEDLLDVTRVQTGQFQLDLYSTNLAALTRKVVERLQTTTTLHHLRLHTAHDHIWVIVDALRFEQVLSNLLNNAIKYSPGGGSIEVILEEKALTQEAYLSIRDHGMGIPREQQPYLFGRFVRADNARAAGIRGTGLGLYLCQELVERHGGHISFESEEGVGSTFFISLPLTETNEN